MSGRDRSRKSPGWQITEWLLGILGGIATFLGLFALLADEDQYVGFGGDLAWRVGDISSAWAYGLLIGGGLLLLTALGMVVFVKGRAGSPAKGASHGLTELLWHGGIFAVVNGFIWLQDIAIGGGVEYAYWVTIPWAIGLSLHAVAYISSRGKVEDLPEAMRNEDASKELQHH